VTRATPKIADYPFTTLSPQLGIAEVDPSRRLVIADIPGLIEGAAEGHGLGHEFLRHIERTKVIVHLIDIEPPDGSNPAENYRAIRRELAGYSAALAEKPEIIAISKTDLLGAEAEDAQAALDVVRSELKLGHDTAIMPISSVARTGLPELLEACWGILDKPAESWKS